MIDGRFYSSPEGGQARRAYWLLRLPRDGKRKDIGLGSAKLLPVAEARQKANELRKAIKIDGATFWRSGSALRWSG